jgi:hypothetical protein
MDRHMRNHRGGQVEENQMGSWAAVVGDAWTVARGMTTRKLYCSRDIERACYNFTILLILHINISWLIFVCWHRFW